MEATPSIQITMLKSAPLGSVSKHKSRISHSGGWRRGFPHLPCHPADKQIQFPCTGHPEPGAASCPAFWPARCCLTSLRTNQSKRLTHLDKYGSKIGGQAVTQNCLHKYAYGLQVRPCNKSLGEVQSTPTDKVFLYNVHLLV